MDTSLLMLGALALGLVAVTCVHYLWWRPHPRTVSARLASDGVQVVEVLVRDGYHPSSVRVRAGQPVRLMLRRDESDACSAGIYFTEPPLRRRLPAFATTVITFTPEKTGTHLFTCEEGRYRGHLIVEPPSRSHTPVRALACRHESGGRLRPPGRARRTLRRMEN
jgi:plastocyanin domain-containing protein